MKITRIDLHAVKGRHWPRFPMVFVEVLTDEGLSGVGESLAYRTTGLKESVRELGDTIIGKDPLRIEALWEGMYRAGGNMAAVSGIETALWDILGKALGSPVYALLGGRCRDRIPVYADGFFRGATYEQEAYARKARQAVQEGFTALAKVSREVSTPICTGELMETRFAFRELFERQAADIIMPDLARTGGILEMKKIAAMADAYHIPVAPHNMVGPVATIAGAHLCACIPNFMILEYQMGDVPWRDELLGCPLPLENGYLTLSDKPGFGIELNRKAMAKYRAE